MLILGIDTSTMVCSVALARENQIVGEYTLQNKKTHSQRLMPLISAVIENCDFTPGDLGGISVTCGPGSFTGIRIGVAAARALSQALGIPLVGIPTLDVLAFQFNYGEGLICPLLDARRGEVYSAVYRSSGEQIERITNYMAVPLRELLEFLIAAPEEKIIFLGDAMDKYRDLLQETLKARACFAPPFLRVNRGALVAYLGLNRICSEKHRDNYLHLKPMYLRRSEAEVKWEERQKGDDGAAAAERTEP
ncbi:tRNA (adenosine(37)-N6)-threonylcarbamoyltransferase complex dimerization subunit type 1 TsaB [Candidatus Contubernalis alkaliaceticus]|uniref:tRNA (adenosine(37)-N6)-threonylcarbamoyltransferase complex dimerization subunit type 1 TsaB n=1 Tax=Candidatus Contubernalis alkaliaceticus TaxID=338645 RepID=UPI001F4BDB1F|nr:tRNA (adenosine(37)-N6)-threonylcarbamoyltransferase complex dimerization subunit type 1 TsaB [Candidatus Contubernalis alkalaceticus]UNC91444.1 tRNA (adenosine(37)-N6)-threonylcarbamoyltransferase complex dimerization subunit type 1 TsaB [Candidatus Contubernalis alkalaceticus]